MLYALMMVIFRPIVAKYLDCYPEHYFFYPSIVLYTVGMLILSQANSVSIILISGIILGLSYGVLNPCLQNIVMKQTAPQKSGAATATFFFFSDFGYGVGSFVLGFIANFSDYRTMYIASAIVSFVSLIFYYLFYHIRKSHATVSIQK